MTLLKSYNWITGEQLWFMTVHGFKSFFGSKCFAGEDANVDDNHAMLEQPQDTANDHGEELIKINLVRAKLPTELRQELLSFCKNLKTSFCGRMLRCQD